MTGNLADVVQQFRQVISELDQAAITAEAAQEHAGEATTHYVEVTRGTDHPDVNRAKYESNTAGEKAGKVARLLADAASAFAEYVNTIAPGSVPSRVPSSEATPDGRQFLDTTRRGPLSSRLVGRAGSIQNAEDGLQHVKKTANSVQDAMRPTGTATSKSTSAFVKSQESQGPQTGDALLAALTLTVMGIKGAELAARLRRKAKNNENQKGQTDSNGREHEIS